MDLKLYDHNKIKDVYNSVKFGKRSKKSFKLAILAASLKKFMKLNLEILKLNEVGFFGKIIPRLPRPSSYKSRKNITYIQT